MSPCQLLILQASCVSKALRTVLSSAFTQSNMMWPSSLGEMDVKEMRTITDVVKEMGFDLAVAKEGVGSGWFCVTPEGISR